MKSLYSAMALMSVLPLSGCGGNSAAVPQNANIDCAVEIQLAVVTDWNPEEDLQSGDWEVAASWVFPVDSAGPGHVVCNTDGAIIELEWSDVHTSNDGTEIGFDGFGWKIQNRIDRRDDVSQTLGGRELNGTRGFDTDFMPFSSNELDTALDDDELRQQSDRSLVIRGRVLPAAPAAEPLRLGELTESQ